ncbi:MAG: circadian clock protein KaiA [Cyanobacteria bacterium J06632_3]
MVARLLVGVFTESPFVTNTLKQTLSHSAFVVNWIAAEAEFVAWVTDNRHRIDCLVVQQVAAEMPVLSCLQSQSILLPAIAIRTGDDLSNLPTANYDGSQIHYHPAVVWLPPDQVGQIETQVSQAIEQFIQLPVPDHSDEAPLSQPSADSQDFLLSLQQQRLIEKLQERLGYLGVYYKRSSQNFFRNMTPEERHEFLNQLRQDYRRIILNYFSKGERAEKGTSESELNQQIDDYVNLAFFADISVSKIVEIHMELMDDFSKQLHIEGRSEDILLDYRLTLIDVIAHLCEMYRRSIPREQ